MPLRHRRSRREASWTVQSTALCSIGNGRTPACRVAVSLTCRNDRALHQHVPNLRKFLCFLQISLIGQITDNGPDFPKVDSRRLPNRAVYF
jgi:hypothetical protein